MVAILDLRSSPKSGLFYSGNDCCKEGVLIDGEPWIAKYPRTTRDLKGKHLPSYTSSPVSEYIGSHVYASLGIPTQVTELGYRCGKVVCACKDFTYPGMRLFEFKEIKNALSDEDEGFSVAPSDGESVYLNDVLTAIETSDLLKDIPGVKERFWDMFVVDAFLKNPDRNNGNWGVLMTAPLQYELAPVYDLGSSLFSKRSASLAEKRLEVMDNVEQDAFGTNISCYKLALPEGGSEAIHPFSYMKLTHNPDLSAAIKRFAETVDFNEIDRIIDEVPNEAFGVVLITDAVKRSHKELLRYRFEKGIVPLLS